MYKGRVAWSSEGEYACMDITYLQLYALFEDFKAPRRHAVQA